MPGPRMLKWHDHDGLIRKLVHFVVGKAASLGRTTDSRWPQDSAGRPADAAHDVLSASPYIIVAPPTDAQETNRWAVRHYGFAAPIAAHLPLNQAKTLCDLLNAANKFSTPSPTAVSNDRTPRGKDSAF